MVAWYDDSSVRMPRRRGVCAAAAAGPHPDALVVPTLLPTLNERKMGGASRQDSSLVIRSETVPWRRPPFPPSVVSRSV